MHDPCRVLVPFDGMAHEAVRRAASAAGGRGCRFVDATAGNGHDTAFLAELAGESGHVYAFDVQEQALQAVRRRLDAAGTGDRVTLIHAGHERMAGHVPGSEGVVAVLFNLGFLPGSDKTTATQAKTTLEALRAAVGLVCVHGILSVHLYTGHPGGEEECGAVLRFFEELPRRTWRVQFAADGNKPRNTEWLVLAERIQEHPSGPQAAPSALS